MKHITSLLLILLVFACSKSPTEPSPYGGRETVIIEHLGTEYVETDPPASGLITTKVNVLSFQIRAENFHPRAVEFYGRAILEGPPWNREHAIYFRTDSLIMNVQINGFSFNTAQSIEPGSTYTLIRPKYPTNEYSPFAGIQGKVQQITITEAWAINDEGGRFSVAIDTTCF
jgi:hypothetical protein